MRGDGSIWHRSPIYKTFLFNVFSICSRSSDKVIEKIIMRQISSMLCTVHGSRLLGTDLSFLWSILLLLCPQGRGWQGWGPWGTWLLSWQCPWNSCHNRSTCRWCQACCWAHCLLVAADYAQSLQMLQMSLAFQLLVLTVLKTLSKALRCIFQQVWCRPDLFALPSGGVQISVCKLCGPDRWVSIKLGCLCTSDLEHWNKQPSSWHRIRASDHIDYTLYAGTGVHIWLRHEAM